MAAEDRRRPASPQPPTAAPNAPTAPTSAGRAGINQAAPDRAPLRGGHGNVGAGSPPRPTRRAPASP